MKTPTKYLIYSVLAGNLIFNACDRINSSWSLEEYNQKNKRLYDNYRNFQEKCEKSKSSLVPDHFNYSCFLRGKDEMYKTEYENFLDEETHEIKGQLILKKIPNIGPKATAFIDEGLDGLGENDLYGQWDLGRGSNLKPLKEYSSDKQLEIIEEYNDILRKIMNS